MWLQRTIRLRPRPRGFHLVTEDLSGGCGEIRQIEIGLVTFFIQHTSASLSINENADPTVRQDLEVFLNRAVPERAAYFRHTLEGDDDMPAHIKCSLLGASVTVPIGAGRLLLGTWQGIYLGEHRDDGGSRTVVATLQGQPRQTG
ncbi:MAG: YjbQ family protein [Gammaproteobacteria bacterium]|nr:YjbQ family protein [Gammaproteobacteria bacterium]